MVIKQSKIEIFNVLTPEFCLFEFFSLNINLHRVILSEYPLPDNERSLHGFEAKILMFRNELLGSYLIFVHLSSLI